MTINAGYKCRKQRIVKTRHGCFNLVFDYDNLLLNKNTSKFYSSVKVSFVF